MNENENIYEYQLNQEKEDKTIELQEHAHDGNEQTATKIPTSAVQAAESMVRTREVAAPSHVSPILEAPLPKENTLPTMPSQVHAAQVDGASSLVYALGKLGYDFGTESNRDVFVQHMRGRLPNPDDPAQLLVFLEAHPEYTASLIWTLSIEASPVYAIVPACSFASITYDRLLKFLKDQQTKGVERVSIPGVLLGKTKRLLSGQVLPVVVPELRGMYSLSTPDLIRLMIDRMAKDEDEATKVRLEKTLRTFLDRLYYNLMNLGRTSPERAMNYAGTSLFQAFTVVMSEIKGTEWKYALDCIEVERSLICRLNSDCWDVKITFFNPSHRLEAARNVYRFTVDVSGVMPVSIGEVRHWRVY